jgi:hypothetical protein
MKNHSANFLFIGYLGAILFYEKRFHRKPPPSTIWRPGKDDLPGIFLFT